MRSSRFLAVGLIALPIALLTGIGCGIPSLPVDGTQAALANATFIHLHVDLVDQDGVPLDDMQVSVTRYHLDASPLMPGKRTSTQAEKAQHVSKVFDYSVFGNCAVTVVFAKTGYATERHTYGTQDFIDGSAKSFMGGPGTSITCENINKNPPKKIVLKRVAPNPS